MAGTGTGQILGFTAVDSPSANPTAIYPLESVNPVMKTLTTIKYDNTTIKIIDTAEGIPYSSVPGTPIPPNLVAVPPELPRPVVVPVQNTTVFMEGNLVTVDGDGVAGPGAVPNPRILHGSSIYGTIIIGTNPI